MPFQIVSPRVSCWRSPVSLRSNLICLRTCPNSIQLGAGRDPVIHHQQVQALMAVLLMYGGNQHSLRGDAHHLAGGRLTMAIAVSFFSSWAAGALALAGTSACFIVRSKIRLPSSCPMPLCKDSKLAQYLIREIFSFILCPFVPSFSPQRLSCVCYGISLTQE